MVHVLTFRFFVKRSSLNWKGYRRAGVRMGSPSNRGGTIEGTIMDIDGVVQSAKPSGCMTTSENAEPSTAPTKASFTTPKVMGGIVIAYILAVVGYGFFVPKLFDGPPAGAGIFGDMFGAFNAFFTGLAFIGLFFRFCSKQNKSKSKLAS